MDNPKQPSSPPLPAANIAQNALNRANRTGQMLSPWLQRYAVSAQPAVLSLRQRPAAMTTQPTFIMLDRLQHVTQPTTWRPDIGSLKPGMTDNFAAAVEQRFEFKPIGVKQVIRQDEGGAEAASTAYPPLAAPSPATEPKPAEPDPRQIMRQFQAAQATRTGSTAPSTPPLASQPPAPTTPEPAPTLQPAPTSPLARLLEQFPEARGGQVIPPPPKSTKKKKPAKPFIGPNTRIFSRVQEGSAGNPPDPTTGPRGQESQPNSADAEKPLKIKPTPSTPRAADREPLPPKPASGAEEGQAETEGGATGTPAALPTRREPEPSTPTGSEFPVAPPLPEPPSRPAVISPDPPPSEPPPAAPDLPLHRAPAEPAAPPAARPATSPSPTAAQSNPADIARLQPAHPALPAAETEISASAPAIAPPQLRLTPADAPPPDISQPEPPRQAPANMLPTDFPQPAPPHRPQSPGDAPLPGIAQTKPPLPRITLADAPPAADISRPELPPLSPVSPGDAPPLADISRPELPLPPVSPGDAPPLADISRPELPLPPVSPGDAPPAADISRPELPLPPLTRPAQTPPTSAPPPTGIAPAEAETAQPRPQLPPGDAPPPDLTPTAAPLPPQLPQPRHREALPGQDAPAPAPAASTQPEPPRLRLTPANTQPAAGERDLPLASAPEASPTPAAPRPAATPAALISPQPGIDPAQPPAVEQPAKPSSANAASEPPQKRSLIFLDRAVVARTGIEPDFSLFQPPRPSQPPLLRRPARPTPPPKLVARQVREQLVARGWRFKTKPGEATGGGSRQVIQAAASLERSSSQGQPLAPQPRAQMEGLMQRDFSGVRIHRADLGALNVQAATRGSDVYVDRSVDDDFSQPESMALLGHELTHVSQQTGPTASPATGSVARLPAGVGAQEAAAERTEHSIYRFARSGEMPLGPAAVQRAPEDEVDTDQSSNPQVNSQYFDLAQNTRQRLTDRQSAPSDSPGGDNANTELFDELQIMFEGLLDEKLGEMLEAMSLEPAEELGQGPDSGPKLDDLARDVLPFVKRLIAVERERRV